ncbi:flagellar basal body P-ring protein FlgI [Afifella pfennigii]|uniref:flagellar basal body P-ring protein FlgI n=1 Tax=Afifella pfennigii TaxID=209897 RepID=UPI00047A533C|nr:flagellar basal body P-ring protein FlgI [Afifella pfennigii]
MRRTLAIAATLSLLAVPAMAADLAHASGSTPYVQVSGGTTRIKDISSVQGVRENMLIGYGLVIGLQGTGDTMRNAPYTEQALQSMLDQMGVNVRGIPLRGRNVAAVTVTANLPPFAGPGSEIDVNVASIGDATSLKGGTLLMTPLMGPDEEVYAVAQGPVAVSGLTVQGQAETLTQGVPTVGRIPNGAIMERAVGGGMEQLNELVLVLTNPDFKTAVQITDAVNAFSQQRFGRALAMERDLRSVVVKRPSNISAARLLSEIGDLAVTPDTPARVVVDQRTGTVVIGEEVQISTVALTHGNLTVRVTEFPQVSQPAPFSDGVTVVTPASQVDAEEQDGRLAVVGGTDLQELVQGLNQIGLKPTDIIAILQAIKTSGALQAELIVQ